MSINLLPAEAKFLANRIKFRKQSLRTTYIIGGVWLGLMVVTYVVWFIFRQINLAEINKLTLAEEAYGQLSSHLITNQKLRYRVKLVSEILDKRFEYAKAFKTITKLFPETVNISKFQLEDGGSFLVDGEVSGHNMMDEVEKRLIEINTGKSNDFKSATLKSLAVDGRTWTFSVQVILK